EYLFHRVALDPALVCDSATLRGGVVVSGVGLGFAGSAGLAEAGTAAELGFDGGLEAFAAEGTLALDVEADGGDFLGVDVLHGGVAVDRPPLFRVRMQGEIARMRRDQRVELAPRIGGEAGPAMVANRV